MKIGVYAICKNEEQHADRWMDAVGEADSVTVLDTGSTDKTIERLRKRGARVFQYRKPFRFDAARNRALELVPFGTDVCVSSDLDEVLQPGWSDAIRAQWSRYVSRGRIWYVYSENPDGSPACQFWLQRVHSRHGCEWKYPVHECLVYTGRGPQTEIDLAGVESRHYPASKNRGFYLPLLQLGVKENPTDRRASFYLGREHMYAGNQDNGIRELTRYLGLPGYAPPEEISTVCRYIGRMESQRGDFESARKWLFRAILEAPQTREPYWEMGQLEYGQQSMNAVYYWMGKAIEQNVVSTAFINESEAWSESPYDKMALACYYTGRFREAVLLNEQAMHINPMDQRLKENHQWYISKE